MTTIRTLLSRAALTVILLGAPSCAPAGDEPDAQAKEGALVLKTPESIAHEHAEIHEVLAQAAGEAGALGAAARRLEAVLGPHFRREEEIATPPLSLLAKLAAGEPAEGMRDVLPMTDALESELPRMLEEHEAVRQALATFRAEAEAAERADYVRFSDALAAHARQEEEILYPAAIVVGRYVKAATDDR